ncbi:MAG: hypothetical protein CSA34_01150 [Desulfobulbus propionicus]|nr:MAG: hypothetical protein CSA34_01150 [Desulfobulbus propionicus]
MVPAEDRLILESFVSESLGMLQQAETRIQELVLQEYSEDLNREVASLCFRIFRSIGGTAGFFKFEHLGAPATACEQLLGRYRQGLQLLNQKQVTLLVEACRFMQKSLKLVLEENSDEQLAESAAEMVMAIREEAAEKSFLVEAEIGKDLSPEEQESFLWEIDELLEIVEHEFVLWQYVAVDQDRALALQQILNRLWSNFSLLNLAEIERLGEAMKTSMDRFLDGEVFQGGHPERVFIRAVDTIREALARFGQEGTAFIEELDEQLLNFQSLIHQPIGEMLVEAGLVGDDALEEALAVQKEERERTQDSRKIGEVLVDLGKITNDEMAGALSRQQEIKEVSSRVERVRPSDFPTMPLLTFEGGSPHREIPVDALMLRRVQYLITRLGDMQGDAEGQKVIDELLELGQTLTLVRVSSIVPRLKRVVHDLAFRFDRKVHFRLYGVNEELEREVLELLTNPLLHLLRNGVQHGLESSDQRIAAAKSETGTLILTVLRRKNEEVWVSVEDDGQGLDLELIGERVKGAGLYPQDDLSGLTSCELADLLFRLAYAEAGSIDDMDGRIVGMETVRRSMEKLQGRADVVSSPGRGTRVTLRIPLHLEETTD